MYTRLLWLGWVLVALTACGCGGGSGSKKAAWVEYGGNPLIRFGDVFQNAFWNDPSVVATSNGYRMWLSAGDLYANPIPVHVYEAVSSDGIAWSIDPTPRLSPTGDLSDFDGVRVETPEVIKVGSTWHLYYSGCTGTCEDGVYAIGHATSSDGVNWTRDPANPILLPDPDPERWGSHTAAEPGLVYSNAQFYLYHVGARTDLQTGETELAILLATSSDGTAFSPLLDANGERVPVVRVATSERDRFEGLTQPDAFLDADGRIHLIYTYVSTLDPFRTHALAHAVSDDGVAFREIEREILPAGRGDWKDASGARAASALLEAGALRLWFQGNTDLTQPGFQAGIGTAYHPSF